MRRHFNSYFLIFSLGLAADLCELATAAAQKSIHIGNYEVVIAPSNTDFADAKVKNHGIVVASLEHLYTSHIHPLELHGDELFWMKRTADYQKDRNWTDQLWVINLKSKESVKLVEQRGFEFRASPDGKRVTFTQNESLNIFERNGTSAKTIAKKGDGGRDDGFTLLQWSKDGRKFWFGAGIVDSWSKLGLYTDGKVRWLPYRGGSVDEAFDPDLGLLVTSEAPFNYDVEDEKKFTSSKSLVHLVATEVLTGKRAEIATAATTSFHPQWSDAKILNYQLKGETRQISLKTILARLK